MRRRCARTAWFALLRQRFICSTVTGKPQAEIVATASAAVLPTTPAGELIAKYTPGSSTVAAIIAMIATSDSSSMPP
jgi:hypothetical protein